MRTAELTLKNDLVSTLNEFLEKGTCPKNVRWWKAEINTLKKLEHSKNADEKRIALNTIDYLSSYCYELGKEYMIRGKIDIAIYIYRLGTIILPESKYFYQQLTKLRAMSNSLGQNYLLQNSSSRVA